MIYKYPEHQINGLNYTKLAFSMLSYLPDSILSTLGKSGRFEDLKNTVYQAALESYRGKFTVKQTRAYTMKLIRKELGVNGIRRSSRFSRTNKSEMTQTEFTRDYVTNEEKIRLLEQLNSEETERVDYEVFEFYLPTVLIDALLEISNELNQTMDNTAEEALIIGLGEIYESTK